MRSTRKEGGGWGGSGKEVEKEEEGGRGEFGGGDG